jgi:peptidoglycan/xylan/chitin deacetylase (PgdA/CDA1 family)
MPSLSAVKTLLLGIIAKIQGAIRLINRLLLTIYLVFFYLFSLPANALVVLQYHHIDEGTPASTSISPEQFRQHMALIESLGLEVVDLESATRNLLEQNTPTEVNNQVAISFDDAYYSIMANAYPELKRRNWPFTIFVNTQAVNEKNRGIMSWQQLKQLSDEGVTIANHSVSHAHLPSIAEGLSLEAWLEQEIFNAQKELQERLGRVANMFAYPYGEFTLPMLPILAQKDMLAFGQQSGPIGIHSHPQALSRFPASGVYANPKTLKTKLLSLAMPVSASQLQEPVIDSNNPPTLSIELLTGDYKASRIQCFASQQGAIGKEIKYDQDKTLLITQADNPLNGKRARYNCTAPSRYKGRYYWYSQPWQMY